MWNEVGWPKEVAWAWTAKSHGDVEMVVVAFHGCRGTRQPPREPRNKRRFGKDGDVQSPKTLTSSRRSRVSRLSNAPCWAYWPLIIIGFQGAVEVAEAYVVCRQPIYLLAVEMMQSRPTSCQTRFVDG